MRVATKDIAGKDLKVGDKVATTLYGYSHLSVVKILGFTPQKIRIETPTGYCTKFSNQVCLVESL